MKITKNVLVNIEHRLSDEDGNHLNEGEEELIYLHGGYGHVFADFEAALEGKEVGDSFKITLAPERAFGLYNEAWEYDELLENLPEDIFLGMELESEDEESGELLIFGIESIDETTARLNANHPLAGLTLTFEGVITELQELSDAEVLELLAHEEHDHEH